MVRNFSGRGAAWKKKHLDKKWARLEKEGMTRPKSIEENKERARDARKSK